MTHFGVHSCYPCAIGGLAIRYLLEPDHEFKAVGLSFLMDAAAAQDGRRDGFLSCFASKMLHRIVSFLWNCLQRHSGTGSPQQMG